ncbi:serpin family protein, partial [Rhizobium ruizarguesonis]
LSRVLQKTMIKVDENGTEAAASTSVITERSIDPNLVRVVSDARFAFALRDTRSGLLLAARQADVFLGETRETRILG